MAFKMRLKSTLYLISFATLLAMGHILQKTVLNYGVDRFVFSFIRIASGFLIISGLIFYRGYRPLKVLRTHSRNFVVLGIFFSGFGILIKLWGLGFTTATNASFIMSLSSLSAVFFAFLLLKEKAPSRFYWLVLLMIAGVYLVTTRGQHLLPQKGDLIIFFLVFLIGFMQVYGKKVLANLSVLETAFGRSFYGMVFLGLLIPFFAPGGFSTIPNIKVLLIVLANGITFSGSIIFFYKALQLEGASNSGVFALLVPVITAVLGRFLLGEVLNIYQILGGGIIISGSFFITRIRIKQANF
jgi:drug/metabolite transporter (DMT)-like permease